MSSDGAMLTLAGLPTARGLVSGPVFVYRGDGAFALPEYVVETGREDEEVVRLDRARRDARRDLENLLAVLRERAGREEVNVFESHLLLLDDPLLVEAAEGHVRNGHLNAESAVHRTANEARARFERMNDPYFRERVRDLDDIERRLLKALLGFAADPALELKAPAIVVADDLTPSEAVRLPREFLLGFATNGGSTTSHVALLARAMGIPAVTGLKDVTAHVTAGETMLLDGTTGTVTIRPNELVRRAFDERCRRAAAVSSAVAPDRPAGSLRDGGEILICANVHPSVPLDGVRQLGARGIGLYRSEYLWLNGEGEPSEEDQFAAYRDAAAAASSFGPEASVTIRTLDIGGDKIVQGITQNAAAGTKEANPFLGNRSIRYLLSHPDVFRAQLRAILRASAFGPLRLMHPMVTCVEELRAAAAILSDVKGALRAEGVAFDEKIPVGAMIEVPAAALAADALAREVDFLSIGTNDLVQYTLAADRGNDAVAHLYQPLHPAVLALVEMTVAAARRAKIPVGVCGESASDPILGVLWAAMGADSLSMSATYVPALARIFAALTKADLANYLAAVKAIRADASPAERLDVCRAWLKNKVGDAFPNS